MDDLLLALWFFIPAGAANAAPILAAHILGASKLDTPMDFGTHFRGERLLGSNKTWRGIAAGIVLATGALWLQQLFTMHILHTDTIFGLHYGKLPTIPLGILFAIGALGGDALKSFFKRRLGTKPGRSWFPFDQLDYIIGAALLTAFIVRLPTITYAWAIIAWVLIHLAATFTGYRLGLKERPI